jgi:uncharacterized membrane protein
MNHAEISQLRRVLPAVVLLLLASAAATMMVGVRWLYAGRSWHAYLVWNLMLAWLPLACAAGTMWLAHARLPQRWPVVLGAAGWMLCFPHAPYLVTDLVHLHPLPPVPQWYDALMMLTFAGIGLVLGIISLRLMQSLVEGHWGCARSWGFVLAALALGSFGIYLGRFHRWNSWDIVRHPMELFGSILDRILAPWNHPRMMGFCVCCFVFLLLAYLTICALAGSRRPPLSPMTDRHPHLS